MRVLITGAAGFLGRRLVRGLAGEAAAVVAADLEPPAGVDGATAVALDLADATAVRRVVAGSHPDIVVHAGAVVGMPAAAADLSRAAAVNILGTQHVLEALRQEGQGRLINISTQDVYGHFPADPVNEDARREPVSIYGATKAAAEMLVDQYRRLFGVEGVNLRGSWLYDDVMEKRKVTNAVVDGFLAGQAFSWPNGRDAVMDFVHLDDVLALIRRVVDAPHWPETAYNMGSGQATPLAGLCALVAGRFGGRPFTLGDGPFEMAEGFPIPRQGALAMDRAHRDFGFSPAVSIEDGVDRTLRAAGYPG